MSEEQTKKISFGFTKVSKKNNIIQSKVVIEDKKDIQFIDCLEGKSIKLVSGEEGKKKELPVIPLRNGNLLRDSIQEVVKSRIQQEELNTSESLQTGEVKKVPLSLDELAAKEILEDLTKNKDKENKTDDVSISLNSQLKMLSAESSTLEDYDNMPISDFGLAMLRGMGWDPKKGIGLNEKIVTPSAPTLRPKGMGLGADKVPTVKSVSANGEMLIMKKDAPVKIVSGPYNNLYGKIEGFDELPGRLIVRLTANNVIVSLNEIMVALVSVSEFNNSVQCDGNQTRSEKSVTYDGNRLKTEKKRLNDAEVCEYISSSGKKDRKNDKEKEENSDRYIEKTSKVKYRNESDEHISEINNYKYSKKKKSKKSKRDESSSSESTSNYKQNERKKKHKSRSKDSYREDYKRSHKEHGRRRSSSSSTEYSRKKKKSNRSKRHDSSSSSLSEEINKSSWKNKRFETSGADYRNSAYEKVSRHARRYK